MHHRFQKSIVIPSPVTDVFTFFTNAANLQRITPPELCFKILTREPIKMDRGTRIDYRLKLFGIPFTWSSLIAHWEPPIKFVDIQKRGPYKEWVHTHLFLEDQGCTRMIDEVSYQLPLWPFGEIFYGLVHHELSRIFRFRERSILEIFELEVNSPFDF